MANIYSFSKLDTAHSCKRNYYFTYIQNKRGGENIYSFLGTAVHDIAEDLDRHKITNEQAVKQFLDAVEESDMMGFKWISEKTKTNYIECLSHYFTFHIPYQIERLHIEDYFGLKIGDVIVQGYIDKWHKDTTDVYIDDYKSSSKFKPEDLQQHKLQLLTYAIHLLNYYPECKFHLRFNMMKYALQKGRLVQRNELKPGDFSDGLLEVDCSNDELERARKFIVDTAKSVEEINSKDIFKWPRGYNPDSDFFCKNLCGNRSLCINYRGGDDLEV